VEDMERRDEELQALVKSWMGRIPVRELDILIIVEIGKNISGAGMDTKVINRSINCHYNPLPDAPQIHRIFLRDLSDLTYNNGVGLGMADIVTDRLVNRIDWKPTHINSLTASTPAAIRTPIHFPTDRECLERIWPTVGKFSVQDVTFGWMRNTMELGLFAFSSNLLDEIRANPMLEIVAGPVDLTFDATGNLVDLKKLAAEGVGTTV